MKCFLILLMLSLSLNNVHAGKRERDNQDLINDNNKVVKVDEDQGIVSDQNEQSTDTPVVYENQDFIDDGINRLEEVKETLNPITTQDPMTVEEAALEFSVDLDSLKAKFPEANFYTYTNRVGDYKSVTLVRTREGKTFVLGRVSPKYEKKYNKFKIQKRRPDAIFFTLQHKKPGGQDLTIKAVDFMGPQIINPFDLNQIKQLAQMGIAFAQEKDTFDPNLGNIVVNDGKLYYIDKDLTYAPQATMSLNLLKNIENSMSMIHGLLEQSSLVNFKEDFLKFSEELVSNFKKIFPKILEAYTQEIKKIDKIKFKEFQDDYKVSKAFMLNVLTGKIRDLDGKVHSAEWRITKFEEELEYMARRVADYRFEEKSTWDAPTTELGKRIISDLHKVFDLFEQSTLF